LRTPTEWFCDPARIHREAVATIWLTDLLPPGLAPPLVFEDRPRHLLAVECVPQPHESWKEMLLSRPCDDLHIDQFGRLLGLMHARASERRAQMPAELEDKSFFEALRLEPYYQFVADRLPEAADFLNDLADRTRGRRDTLAHGDYSPKNILVHDDRLVLVDHEVAHWGDASFDVGFSLAHLLGKAHFLAGRRAELSRAAERYWHSYRRHLGPVSWGGDLEYRAVEHTLACLLARAAGRSPLEYLNDAQRARQQEAAIALMRSPPPTIAALIAAFLERL
jgi:tRNA A-37 threonylcarbamoyl transferase component Bud32